jgi:polysaccharide export outer membrane protein
MHKRVKKGPIRSMSLACAGVIMMVSCSTAPPQHVSAPQTNGLVNDPVLGVADAGTRCTIPAMVDLWRRRADARLEDYPLGPGDEITISVPEVDELQNQHMRVAQDGTINMPLVGTVLVGGLDEDRAREAISHRLATYMREPRLEMYVVQYRSRGVAVAGAVQKPGVYDLATFSDSLNDMIAMAGGLTSYAAQRAVFLPIGMTQYSTVVSDASAEGGENLTPINTTANQPVLGAYGDRLASRVSITVPFGRTGDTGCLNMPARPGDVILVPAAGTVTVIGWVQNPGSFAISPGMTVLGAVTAAGGAVFSWHAEVMRTDQNGTRVVKRLSLSDLESGKETDIPVEAGDIVLMEKSVAGAVPYGMWELFERFGTGVGIGVPTL